MAKKTFYDVLQVSPYADTEIIKAAYNSLIQRFYPDGSPGDPNDDFLKALNKAYEVLSDPAKRAGYDAALADADDGGSHQADAAHFTKKADAASEGNPHKIPAPADASAQTSGSDNVDLYEAAIGEKNTTYYLAKFEQFDQQGPGLKASWNWPAFYCNYAWALYRKMYGWFIVILCINIVSLLFASAFALVTSSHTINILFVATPWAVFAIYANSLYHGKVRKKIEAARLTLRDESRLLAYLRQVGGVHTWVIWVFGFVPIIGIVAAITIPAYQDYQKRAAAQQSQQPATNPWEENYGSSGAASPQNQSQNPVVPAVSARQSTQDAIVPFHSINGLIPGISKYSEVTGRYGSAEEETGSSGNRIVHYRNEGISLLLTTEAEPIVEAIYVEPPYKGRTQNGLFLGMKEVDAVPIIRRDYYISDALDFIGPTTGERTISIGDSPNIKDFRFQFWFRNGYLTRMRLDRRA